METGKIKIDLAGKKVTFGHKTKTTDGSVDLTTTFDLSDVTMERLLYFAAKDRLISWRASSGIKDLTKAEALAKFTDLTVDCSKTVERTKHVVTPEEKALKEMLAGAIASGKSLADIMAAVKKATQSQTEADEQMELEENNQ